MSNALQRIRRRCRRHMEKGGKARCEGRSVARERPVRALAHILPSILRVDDEHPRLLERAAHFFPRPAATDLVVTRHSDERRRTTRAVLDAEYLACGQPGTQHRA